MTIYQKIAVGLMVSFAGRALNLAAAPFQELIPYRCQALLGSVFLDDLRGPEGHFLSSHALGTVLRDVSAPSLRQFFAEPNEGPCTFECQTPDASLLLHFVRNPHPELTQADYTHRFADNDVIFGPVKVEMTEQTLSSAPANHPATDVNLDMLSAEAETRDLVISFLRPRILAAVGQWMRSSGAPHEKGLLGKSGRSLSSLLNLLEPKAKPSFEQTFLQNPQEHLGVIFNHPTSLHYELDRNRQILNIQDATTEVVLKFADSGWRISEIHVSHQTELVRMAVRLEFDNAPLDPVIARYDEQKDQRAERRRGQDQTPQP